MFQYPGLLFEVLPSFEIPLLKVYVCLSIYIYIYKDIDIDICKYTCLYIYIHIYIYRYVYICMYVCVYTYYIYIYILNLQGFGLRGSFIAVRWAPPLRHGSRTSVAKLRQTVEVLGCRV